MTDRLKIYFSGSISGGRDDQDLYGVLIRRLKDHGDVLTEHIGDEDLTAAGENDETDAYIFQRDVDWLQAADVVIAEVTTPSLGVGYELAVAEQLGKPTLCLFRESSRRRLSAMVAGNPALTVARYDEISEAEKQLDRFFQRI